MPARPTKIITDLQPDDPHQQDALHPFDATDRQYIDTQIRGCQQHLANLLINGTIGTYYRLDSGSAALVKGDVFCRSASSLFTVTKATGAALAAAGRALGVATDAASPGALLLGAIDGVVAPSITGLGTTAGIARVSSGARVERVASLGAGDYPLGTIDAGGYLTFGAERTVPAVLGAATAVTGPRLGGKDTHIASILSLLVGNGIATDSTTSPVRTATTTDTATTADVLILADPSSGGPFTISLFEVTADRMGHQLAIFNYTGGPNAVTIAPFGPQRINGVSGTYTLQPMDCLLLHAITTDGWVAVGMHVKYDTAAAALTLLRRNASGGGAVAYLQSGSGGGSFADAGAIRVKNNEAANWRGSGSFNVSGLTVDSSDNVIVGDTTNGATARVQTKTAGTASLRVGANDAVAASSTTVTLRVGADVGLTVDADGITYGATNGSRLTGTTQIRLYAAAAERALINSTGLSVTGISAATTGMSAPYFASNAADVATTGVLRGAKDATLAAIRTMDAMNNMKALWSSGSDDLILGDGTRTAALQLEAAPTGTIRLDINGTGLIRLSQDAIGVFDTAPVVQQTVTGATANDKVNSVIAALEAYGWIIDTSTP